MWRRRDLYDGLPNTFSKVKIDVKKTITEEELLQSFSDRPHHGRTDVTIASVTRTSVEPGLPQQGHSYGPTIVSGNARVQQGDVNNYHFHATSAQPVSYYDQLRQSLAFERMDARVHNVAQPLQGTCSWFTEHPSFQEWWGKGKNFLWVRGKPGSGKSTIMKEALVWAREHRGSTTILSYFFNARSPHELEKSCIGLYRSLTYQLLSLLPSIRHRITEYFPDKSDTDWAEVELQNFWMHLVSNKHLPSVAIFVDALDEGSDDDVRAMINFFSQLNRSVVNDRSIMICLSSRPYPNITIRNSLLIVVEEQTGHDRDIKSYIKDQLEDDGTALLHEIREAVYKKSSGVFLWVVLVVARLNKAYDRGHTAQAMMDELVTVPLALLQLISSIFVEGTDQEVLTQRGNMMIWLLYAASDFGPVGLRSAVDMTFKPLLAASAEAYAAEAEQARRWVIDVSCGLVEVVQKSAYEDFLIVQLIHESVRDLLLTHPGDQRICGSEVHHLPSFDASASHSRLADQCLQHLTPNMIDPDHPLADYIVRCWPSHVRQCTNSKSDELVQIVLNFFLDTQGFSFWLEHAIGIQEEELTNYGRIQVNYCSLIDAAMQSFGCDPPPIFLSTCLGLGVVVAYLIANGSDVELKLEGQDSLLYTASVCGHADVIRVLLENGAVPNAQPGFLGYPLHAAVSAHHVAVVKVLLAAGATVNAESEQFGSALQAAAETGVLDLVKLLVEAGADVNATAGVNGTALQLALFRKHFELASYLVEHGADPDLMTDAVSDEPPLYTAIAFGATDLIRQMLKAGARIDAVKQYILDDSLKSYTHKRIELSRVRSTLLLAENDPSCFEGILSNQQHFDMHHMPATASNNAKSAPQSQDRKVVVGETTDTAGWDGKLRVRRQPDVTFAV